MFDGNNSRCIRTSIDEIFPDSNGTGRRHNLAFATEHCLQLINICRALSNFLEMDLGRGHNLP